jgi:hypothetical protein
MTEESGQVSPWSVPCLDAAGRERRLSVAMSSGRVVVHAPPGETASLSWTAAQELRRLLDMGVREILRGNHVQP